MEKIAIITGASSGLGLSLAVQLAQKGFKVYATMRNLDKQTALQEAARKENVTVEVAQLDVQDVSSVNQCVADIHNKEGRIDALINNAGAGFVRTTEQASEEEIQWVLDVNLMGVIRCTKAVLPYMRQARAGRIINISSVGGLVGQPFNEIYCAAKFAVEGYTEAVASYLQPNFNVKFTVIEPGGIRSEFASSALKQFQASGGMKDDEYKPILERYIAGAQRRAASATKTFQSSDEVAAVVVACLESDDPPVRLRTSPWAEELCELKTKLDPTGKILQAKVIENFLS